MMRTGSWGKQRRRQEPGSDRWDELIAELERRDLEDPAVTAGSPCQPAPSFPLDWVRVTDIVLPWPEDSSVARRPVLASDSQAESTGFGAALSALHGLHRHFAFLIIGDEQQTAFYLGLGGGPLSPGRSAQDELKRVLLSAMGPASLQPVPESSLATTVRSMAAHIALLHGVPTFHIEESEGRYPIHRLAEGLRGERWGYLILAEPLDADLCTRARRAALMMLSEITLAEEIEKSRYAKHCVTLLDAVVGHLDQGARVGLWRTCGYLFAPEDSALAKAGAIARGVLGGAKSLPCPFRVLTLPSARDAVAVLRPLVDEQQTPGDELLNTLNGRSFAYPLASTVLATLVHLPNYELLGFPIARKARFSLALPRRAHKEWHLGVLTDRGEPTGNAISLPLDDLTKHTLVAGVTGSGKTNTVFGLLAQLQARGVPFLVIEPAKREYRRLMLLPGFVANSLVYTLGDERAAPFRLNPFEFSEGIAVQTHIDQLKSVFVASFVMYAPMPYVLEHCLQEVYTDRGWDLRTSTNTRLAGAGPSGPPVNPPDCFPTLADLYHKVDEVVPRLGYDERISADVSAALKTRIRSLRLGGKGAMLDVRESLAFSELLRRPVLLELERIGDDEEKAFIMGLLLMRLYQECQARGTQASLKHVTVVEEAHRLLRNATGNLGDPEAANTVAKAVETFTNMLSEIRAFGEGVIVCEQIPSKLSPDIVKNTSLKIIHRIVSLEDRELMAGATNLTEGQNRAMATLVTGEAIVFSEATENAVLARIPQFTGLPGLGDVSDAAIGSHMGSQRSALPGPPLRLHAKNAGVYDPELDAMAREVLDSTDVLAVLAFHVSAFALIEKPAPTLFEQMYRAVASRRPGHLSAKRVPKFMAALGLRAMDQLCDSLGKLYVWAYAAADHQKDLLFQMFSLAGVITTETTSGKVRASENALLIHSSWREGWLLLCRLDPCPLPGCVACRCPCLFRGASLQANPQKLAGRISLIPLSVPDDERMERIARGSLDELAHRGLEDSGEGPGAGAFCLAIHALAVPEVRCHPVKQLALAQALASRLFGPLAKGRSQRGA